MFFPFWKRLSLYQRLTIATHSSLIFALLFSTAQMR